ncbi:MAG: hypothetical protein ACRDEA_19405, partial [Microcystaceae cyanobacterium]
MIDDFFKDIEDWSNTDLNTNNDVESSDSESLVDGTLFAENEPVQEHGGWYIPENEDSWQVDSVG